MRRASNDPGSIADATPAATIVPTIWRREKFIAAEYCTRQNLDALIGVSARAQLARRSASTSRDGLFCPLSAC